MADHAPESLSGGERLVRWLEQASNGTLAAYMLALAGVVLLVIFLIDLFLF